MQVFDNKFGEVEVDDRYNTTTCDCIECNCVVNGVGKDAEIVTNSKGGKQSKSPMAMYLVDPIFLYNHINNYTTGNNKIEEAIKDISVYMSSGDGVLLHRAIDMLADKAISLVEISKILQYGAERYAPNNWRLIPREDHINHALVHLVSELAGDKQDDHIPHAMCRLMMAIATIESDGFSYTEYTG